MNAELVQEALKRVGNINTLINVISRRVRQLNAGGGGISRPLVANTGGLGDADIALREVIEGKIGWEMPVLEEIGRTVVKRRRKH